MAAMAIPAVAPETPVLPPLDWSLLPNTLDWPDAALDDAALELPVEVAPPSSVDPGVRGTAGLM